jgi:hypothetical protein
MKKLKIWISYDGTADDILQLKRIYQRPGHLVLISSLINKISAGSFCRDEISHASLDLDVEHECPSIILHAVHKYEGAKFFAELDGKPVGMKIFHLPANNDQSSELIKFVMETEKNSTQLISNEAKFAHEIMQAEDLGISTSDVKGFEIKSDINWALNTGLFSVFKEQVKQINLLSRDDKFEILQHALKVDNQRFWKHLVDCGIKFDEEYLINLYNKLSIPNKYYEYVGLPSIPEEERNDLSSKWLERATKRHFLSSSFTQEPGQDEEKIPALEACNQP